MALFLIKNISLYGPFNGPAIRKVTSFFCIFPDQLTEFTLAMFRQNQEILLLFTVIFLVLSKAQGYSKNKYKCTMYNVHATNSGYIPM